MSIAVSPLMKTGEEKEQTLMQALTFQTLFPPPVLGTCKSVFKISLGRWIFWTQIKKEINNERLIELDKNSNYWKGCGIRFHIPKRTSAADCMKFHAVVFRMMRYREDMGYRNDMTLNFCISWTEILASYGRRSNICLP